MLSSGNLKYIIGVDYSIHSYIILIHQQMRACFKNDNFFLATQKDDEKKKKIQQEKKVQKQLKHKNYMMRYTRSKTQKQIKAEQIKSQHIQSQKVGQISNSNYQFKIASSQGDFIEEDLKEYLNSVKSKKQNCLIKENQSLNKQVQKYQKQREHQDKQKVVDKKLSKNIFSRAFIPKANLTIENSQIKQMELHKKNIQQQRKKQDIKMKKTLGVALSQKQYKTNNNTLQEVKESDKIGLSTNQGDPLNEGNPDAQGGQNSDDIQKNPKKQKFKKIKKVANYQKLDMKRKYKDQFLGGLRRNQRNYAANGRFKQKFKAQSQISIEDGQVYNSFVSSLSRALHVNLYLDDQNQEQNEQLVYQIPTQVNRESLTKFIQDLFGFQTFREGQYEVIQNTLKHQSTIFISQTASGKSLTYIVSSIIMGAKQGMAIVISPLIALMLDQLQHLPIDLPAACISSLLSYEQRNKIISLVKQNKIKLLFMTPETLQSDLLFHIIQFPAVNFVCIDQAHCLSQLSHNFRTSYLALAEIIMNQIKYANVKPTILCLTATANIETINSLQSKLKIQNVVKSSCTINKNLYITISRQNDIQNKSKALVRYLNERQIKKCRGILVYCRARWIMDKVFNYLSNSNINSKIFHGGLSNKEKTQIISSFRDQKIKVILTTTALGMGLDFQHLDCVVHFNMPKSIQSYIQQIGRAGRRSFRAYCHLFLDSNDYLTERNFILADELQSQSLKAILKQIQKSVKNKSKFQKKTKEEIHQDKMQVVIKRVASQIQKMQAEEEEKDQFFQQDSENSKSQNEQIHQSKQFKLFYVKVKELSQKSYLRQQTLLTVLLKIQKLVLQKQGDNENQNLFKVLPLSYEILKLSFFKSNQQQLKQSSQFYNRLIQKNCKKIGKCYHIHLIQKCNQLKTTPIQLLQQIYKISSEYVIKVEFINQVYVWKINQSLNKNKLFQSMESLQFQNKLINQVNSIQTTSISKLNVFYSLAINYAIYSMDNIVSKKMLIGREQPLPQQNIVKDFDKYFKTQLDQFYTYIAGNDQQTYLPTTLIKEQDMIQIFNCIKLFFKHQFSNIGQDQRNRTARKQKIIDQFRDGKIIGRVFMGVNQQKTSRKIYGDHSYWKKFIQKNYHELLVTVRSLITNNQDQLKQL